MIKEGKPDMENLFEFNGEVKSAKLLIVDDEEFNRNMLRRYLIADSFSNIEFAENGIIALQLLRSHPFDAILLDIEMPKLDGYGVLAEVRKDPKLRNIPTIMISGVEELSSIVRCIELGADDYLFKPFNPTLLRARIKASLEKKKLRDQEVFLRRKSEELLHSILPVTIAYELQTEGSVLPRRHENIAILMGDIIAFTPYCESNKPEQVIKDLQEISDYFESLTEKYGLEKMSSVGDSFMAVAGFSREPQESVLNCVRCGLEMGQGVAALDSGLQMRFGVHIGPVVAGVVGKRKFVYGLFGDTVNTSSRMESNGRQGVVCLSAAAWKFVSDSCHGQSQGLIDIKGKGQMEIFYVSKDKG